MKEANRGYDLTIKVNEFDLSYNDIGEGRVPIIFLHGFPFDKTMWNKQCEFLKKDYRVIACDIRGFGKSKDEKSPFSMGLFTDDLIQFMDKLAIDKAIVCGLSMGGFITLNAIKRYPERFEALILCDTQCIADTPEVKDKRIKAIATIEENGATSFNEGFIKNVFHKDSLLNKKELVADLSAVIFANTEQIITQGLLALAARTETCSTLGEINVPTLIICGREDAVTPLKQSEYLQKHISGATLKVIENAGHVSNLEQPDAFNECLSNFLKNL